MLIYNQNIVRFWLIHKFKKDSKWSTKEPKSQKDSKNKVEYNLVTYLKGYSLPKFNTFNGDGNPK